MDLNTFNLYLFGGTGDLSNRKLIPAAKVVGKRIGAGVASGGTASGAARGQISHGGSHCKGENDGFRSWTFVRVVPVPRAPDAHRWCAMSGSRRNGHRASASPYWYGQAGANADGKLRQLRRGVVFDCFMGRSESRTGDVPVASMVDRHNHIEKRSPQ